MLAKMRNVIIIALLGFGFAFPGKVDASCSAVVYQVESQKISQTLVEQILRKVEQDHGYSFECLCNQYKNGKVIIDKVTEGYRVTISDGGEIILVIEDF